MSIQQSIAAAMTLAMSILSGAGMPVPAVTSDALACQIKAGPNVQVSDKPMGVREIQIAANPTDAKNLLASGIFLGSGDFGGDGSQRVATYASRDGGQTWKWVDRTPRTKEEGQPPIGGDPIVVFDREGTAYYTNDIHVDVAGNTYNLSHDGGFTWGPAIQFAAEFFDHPMFAVDMGHGRYGNSVYAVGMKADPDPADSSRHLYYLTTQTTRDGGNTWQEKVVVRTKDFGHADYGMNTDSDVLVSSATGRVYVPFHTFPSKYPVPESEMMPLGGEPRPKQRRWMVSSDDGGTTFSPAWVPKQSNGADLMGPLMITYPGWAIDNSGGPFKDRLYALWTEPAGQGQRWQLLLSSSVDGGKTWKSPLVVEQGALDITDYSYDATYPAMKVNRNGVLLLTWYRFEYTGQGAGKDRKVRHTRMMTASLDGGETVMASTPLASQPSSMEHVALGDYLNLAVGPDGTFHSLWMDSRTGKQEMVYAQISVECDGKPAVAHQRH